jgi:hypothetical protein
MLTLKANNNGWTEERKAKQSAMIHKWRPWEKSTGAKTKEGKDISKMNARRVTIMGLYRRMCKLCYYTQVFRKHGYIPHQMKTTVDAFIAENDEWLEKAEIKPKK